MLHETKAKTLLKKIIRKALLDPNIVIIVRDEEGERMNKKVKDIKEIIENIFSVDVSEIYFANKETKEYEGALSIVLQYDSEPEEIICDYFANDYTENLINEFI